MHQNGQIVIGSSYTELMRLNPGDEFEIKLGHKPDGVTRRLKARFHKLCRPHSSLIMSDLIATNFH